MSTIDKLINPGKLSRDITNLPSPPIIIQKLHALMEDRETNVHRVAQIIETDPAFSARVLRLVNSPFYGMARTISSVYEAITILGFNSVHQLLLTTSVMNVFKGEKAIENIDKFWQHCFGVGIVARHLLVNADQETRGGTFVCGILHDVGRLIFANTDPESFTRLYFKDNSASGNKEEASVFGMNHQEAGELLARKWNFPEEIVKVISCHHEPERAGDYTETASAINIADILCLAMGIGESGNEYVQEFDPETWNRLNLTFDQLEEILEKALKEINRSREFLGANM